MEYLCVCLCVRLSVRPSVQTPEQLESSPLTLEVTEASKPPASARCPPVSGEDEEENENVNRNTWEPHPVQFMLRRTVQPVQTGK